MVLVLKNNYMHQRIFIFVHTIIYLNSLLEKLQKFLTLKIYILLEIGLKRIIFGYNQGYIIQELCTWFVE